MLPAVGAAGSVTVKAPLVVFIGYPVPATAGFTLDVCTVVQLIVLGIPDVDAVVIIVPVKEGKVIVLEPATAGTVSIKVPDVSPDRLIEDIFIYPYAVYVPEPAVVHLMIVLDPLVVIVGLPVVVPV